MILFSIFFYKRSIGYLFIYLSAMRSIKYVSFVKKKGKGGTN